MQVNIKSYYNKRNAHFNVQELLLNFGRNVAKRGRNMERHRECNIAEPKFELKLFRPNSCIFYGRSCKIVFHCSETPPSILNQSALKVEEHITVTQGVT